MQTDQDALREQLKDEQDKNRSAAEKAKGLQAQLNAANEEKGKLEQGNGELDTILSLLIKEKQGVKDELAEFKYEKLLIDRELQDKK